MLASWQWSWSWQGFISNNTRDKKHEIFLKNNKKWIKGNRNNLSCADVQKEKIVALQCGFIKSKLWWRRLVQSPICEHRAVGVWWAIRCISFHKNYIIKGIVSKFPLFWLTHLATLMRRESKKKKKSSRFFVEIQRLCACQCLSKEVHSCRRTWKSSTILLCKKGWKR